MNITDQILDWKFFTFSFSFFIDGGSDGLRATTTGFETNVAQIHDWLKLVEQKNKNMIVVLGDDDDMESSLQKTKVSANRIVLV